MRYVLTIDPGLSSGLCLFGYDADGFHIIKRWQFMGGAHNLGKFIRGMDLAIDNKALWMTFEGGIIQLDRIVMEKFTPRPHEGFSLNLKSVEPLRGEGVLIGAGFEDWIDWQEPDAQYFMGGADLADKKKRSREFLKLHALYVTGSILGQPDADDAISATLHSIAWLRTQRHMPTLEQLFGE